MQAQQQTSRQARAAMEVNRQVARPRIALILLLSSLAGAVAVRHHTRHTSGLTDNVAGLLSDGTTLTDLPYTGAPFLVISISSPEVICAHSVFLTMLIGDCLSPIPQVQRHGETCPRSEQFKRTITLHPRGIPVSMRMSCHVHIMHHNGRAYHARPCLMLHMVRRCRALEQGLATCEWHAASRPPHLPELQERWNIHRQMGGPPRS